MVETVVFGNVTLDILCQTVDEVPRYESVSFDQVVLSPGGCASNVAVGLAALGVSTSLVCKIGDDVAAEILRKTWAKFQLNLDHVKVDPTVHTAVSIGLVDHDAQPRFIHTPGANGRLTIDDFPEELFHQEGVKILHIAGFFVLPGLLDERFGHFLKKAHDAGWLITLDVVNSKRYWRPEYLFPFLGEVDVFLCNKTEAMKLSGASDLEESARRLRKAGARCVVVKGGGEGCFLACDDITALIPTKSVKVVDTTGAGDAFAAGLITALVRGEDIHAACQFANECGANVVQELGTITYWERQMR